MWTVCVHPLHLISLLAEMKAITHAVHVIAQQLFFTAVAAVRQFFADINQRSLRPTLSFPLLPPCLHTSTGAMDLPVAILRDDTMQKAGREPILARWIATKMVTGWGAYLLCTSRPGQMFEGATGFDVENSQFTTVGGNVNSQLTTMTVAGNVNIQQAPTAPGVFYFHTVQGQCT
jgi:hypothetical protein